MSFAIQSRASSLMQRHSTQRTREASFRSGQRLKGEVLRLTRAANKSLGASLEASPAEQIRKSEGRVPLRFTRHENERSQNRLS
jgi:hypothetical protein